MSGVTCTGMTMREAFVNIECQKEKCMAWGTRGVLGTKEPLIEGYCKLIEKH
jgi:hypothetical protein